MERWTRRKFLAGAATAAAGSAIAGPSCGGSPSGRDIGTSERDVRTLGVPLDGVWRFRLDPQDRGEAAGWAAPEAAEDGWDKVAVPSTWQVAPKTVDYLGPAWYRREFTAAEAWRGRVVRIEFEAVYHTATVFINGKRAGEHVGQGYTAFALDITDLVEFGSINTIAVRADNSFTPAMLPRKKSYDWTPDGGITRPVRLLVTGPVYIENLWVDAVPDLAAGRTSLTVTAVVRNATTRAQRVKLGCTLGEEGPASAPLDLALSSTVEDIPAGTVREVRVQGDMIGGPVRLWHFDQPHLYVLEASLLLGGEEAHTAATTFGVRQIEVRGTEFRLNGEPVRLAGVERMAGSHPDFGMAEPAAWIEHDHADLKELNCVFTRVHWQQDRRVLDYCDRHGILVQLEVPSWGGGTFHDLGPGELEALTENGLAQLRAMIARDRNHPCVFSWGLCNEVDGQNPVAQGFVRRMLREAKRLDPGRLCSYASNSLEATPERDVAGEMDFIEWNEYYGSWYGGDPAAMRANLEAIHRAFPDKPVVISEYGYCACTADRPEDDRRRAEILRTHNAVFREFPWVAGLIFFDYNDYRTHIGDKGRGVLKQRVHGVVDVFGARKPSFEVLRAESGPVEALEIRRDGAARVVTVRTRKDIPSYALRGYAVRWTALGNGGIPIERGEAPLPELAPGAAATVRFTPQAPDARAVVVEIVRPTGFAAASIRA
jgi:Glycosyl hydrolases family 2, TIM barrel domain/Glycosyl hydrolases family 2, sugar binding domain/Glycosyl hydrolases family 2